MHRYLLKIGRTRFFATTKLSLPSRKIMTTRSSLSANESHDLINLGMDFHNRKPQKHLEY